ncbi:hypothetical protein PBOI14_35070 [Pseudomonas sp. Boi14]|nr:hypothetical protein PBOI14_35070 [Pseudomonas sp. Boi14]
MKRRQQGFTLIEVMVAIMLMAVVSLIAWRGLDSVTRADSHLKASTEQTEELLRTLNQLERDVALRAGTQLREPALGDSEEAEPDSPAPLSVRSSDSKGFRLEVIRSAATPGMACNGCVGGSRATPCTAPWPSPATATLCPRRATAWRC